VRMRSPASASRCGCAHVLGRLIDGQWSGAKQSVRNQMLRQRYDARGFKPPPIEIIARRKVARAFEAIGG
jgi:hypothetical protein